MDKSRTRSYLLRLGLLGTCRNRKSRGRAEYLGGVVIFFLKTGGSYKSSL